MSQYLAVDLDRCRVLQHQFSIFGSDKTPMKRNLVCVDCTIETGKTAVVAYGEDTKSWGQWRRRKREDNEQSEMDGK